MFLKDYRPLSYVDTKNYLPSDVPYYFFSFQLGNKLKLFIRKNKKNFFCLTGYGFHQSPLFYSSSFVIYDQSKELKPMITKYIDFILSELFRGQNELF